MGKSEEPKEVWIARARKGTTKAKRLQAYVNDDLYEWFKELQEHYGLNESQTVKMCLRHVKVEHDMQKRGGQSMREINIDKLSALSGTKAVND